MKTLKIKKIAKHGALPAECENRDVVLLERDVSGAVANRALLRNHRSSIPLHVKPYTHYAVLPLFL